jgi:hypothetical protein
LILLVVLISLKAVTEIVARNKIFQIISDKKALIHFCIRAFFIACTPGYTDSVHPDVAHPYTQMDKYPTPGWNKHSLVSEYKTLHLKNKKQGKIINRHLSAQLLYFRVASFKKSRGSIQLTFNILYHYCETARLFYEKKLER